MTVRNYAGNALTSTLAAGIGAGDATFTVLDGSTWPTTSFVLTLDAGGSEEKVLVGTRSSNTLSGVTRGFDGTVAVTHSAGASVRHTLAAVDLAEANAHVNATTGVHGITGALVGVAAVGAAFAYTPSWTASVAPVLGNGTLVGTYRSAGGIVRGNFTLTIGTTTTLGSGPWTFTLPSNAAGFAPGPGNAIGRCAFSHAAAATTQDVVLNGGNGVVLKDNSQVFSATYPFAWAAGDIISADFTYFT